MRGARQHIERADTRITPGSPKPGHLRFRAPRGRSPIHRWTMQGGLYRSTRHACDSDITYPTEYYIVPDSYSCCADAHVAIRIHGCDGGVHAHSKRRPAARRGTAITAVTPPLPMPPPPPASRHRPRHGGRLPHVLLVSAALARGSCPLLLPLAHARCLCSLTPAAHHTPGSACPRRGSAAARASAHEHTQRVEAAPRTLLVAHVFVEDAGEVEGSRRQNMMNAMGRQRGVRRGAKHGARRVQLSVA